MPASDKVPTAPSSDTLNNINLTQFHSSIAKLYNPASNFKYAHTDTGVKLNEARFREQRLSKRDLNGWRTS